MTILGQIRHIRGLNPKIRHIWGFNPKIRHIWGLNPKIRHIKGLTNRPLNVSILGFMMDFWIGTLYSSIFGSFSPKRRE